MNSVAAESRMAFNHGKPVTFIDDDSLQYARRFLEHPLSISSDHRLVASSELLALRGWVRWADPADVQCPCISR